MNYLVVDNKRSNFNFSPTGLFCISRDPQRHQHRSSSYCFSRSDFKRHATAIYRWVSSIVITELYEWNVYYGAKMMRDYFGTEIKIGTEKQNFNWK